MMAGMLNQMRMAASEAMADRAVTRQGTVSGYDPSNYAVKVTLQPDGTITDWIPLKALAVGNGWGVLFAPAIGVSCEVQFQEDDPTVGTVSGFFFNTEEVPPNVPSGEFWMVHKSGASIKLTNDGAITIDDGAGASIKFSAGTITSAGTWAHSGTFTADGISLTTHTHPVTGSETGEPNP